MRVMTTHLHVRLPDLLSTVDRLGQVRDRLGAATQQVHDCQDAGDLGAAVRAFADHWHHGVTTLHRSVGALHASLDDVHRAYDEHERELSSRLRGQA